MNSDEKHCPYCAEIIKLEAILCRYCKSSIYSQAITLLNENGISEDLSNSGGSSNGMLEPIFSVANIEHATWRYKLNHGEYGPIDYWAFINLICSGVLHPFIEIKLEGTNLWLKLKDVPFALNLYQQYSSKKYDPSEPPKRSWARSSSQVTIRVPSQFYAWCLVAVPVVVAFSISLISLSLANGNVFYAAKLSSNYLWILVYLGANCICVYLDEQQLEKSGIRDFDSLIIPSLITPMYLYARENAIKKAFEEKKIDSPQSPHWILILLSLVLSFFIH